MKTTAWRVTRSLFFIGLVLAADPLRAEIPKPLVVALQALSEQRSYSWEVIDADPGPVAENLQTRRGTVTAVRQSTAPHVKASLASNGDLLLKRDWPDGLQLDTLVTADGQMVTLTPEGWMTSQEILTAISEERIKNNGQSARFQWLRRADRPDTRRPDEELISAVKAATEFEVNGDTYVTRIVPSEAVRERSGFNSFQVTLTVNVRNGVVRDYQLTLQGTRPVARAGVNLPLSDDHFVILTYLPVRKLDVPDEAWAKLKGSRGR